MFAHLLICLNFIYFLIYNLNATKNKRQYSYFISHSAHNWMDCALFCFARSTCKSYTFDKQKCFLFENNYGKTKLNTLTTDIRKQHWNIAKGCRQQLCQPDEYCVSYDKCSYACLKLAINCGLPESVLNAKYVSMTNLTYKGMVQYECVDGYQPIGKKKIRKSFCQLNSKWTKVDLKCSRI